MLTFPPLGVGFQRVLDPDPVIEMVRANAELKRELEAQEEQARAARRRLVAEIEEAEDRARRAEEATKRAEEVAKRVEEVAQAAVAELKTKTNMDEHADFSAASA